MDQNALVQFLPLVLIFVVFYMLLIRPQQKKQKEHRAMLEALRRGDRIVTGGGLLGSIHKIVSPDEVEVNLGQNLRVRVVRSTISSVLAKPEPAAAREAARDRDRETGRQREPGRQREAANEQEAEPARGEAANEPEAANERQADKEKEPVRGETDKA
jgi:preprotein translocase subunit YajC